MPGLENNVSRTRTGGNSLSGASASGRCPDTNFEDDADNENAHFDRSPTQPGRNALESLGIHPNPMWDSAAIELAMAEQGDCDS